MPTTTKSRVEPLEPLIKLVCGLDYPSHYAEWEALLTQKRIVIQASRDHSKTTFFSVLYSIYKAGRNPGFNICILSYAGDQSKAIIQKIKDLIEGRPLLNYLKGSDTWAKHHIRFSNGSNIISKSFGSNVRLWHYDLVIIDDPSKDLNKMNPEEQWIFFKSAVIPTINPDGQAILVGNPVHDGDVMERAEQEKIWPVYKFPAIKNGKPLWPERWSLEALDLRRKEMAGQGMGDYAFAKEYLLERIDMGNAFFKRDWLKKYDVLPERMSKIMSVDPAISAQGDYTAIVVTGTSEDNRTYLLDRANMRTDNIQAIIDEIFRLAMTWGVDFVILETIGFQRLLKHWIHEEMRKRNVFFGIEELKAHKQTKEARIMALQPRLQAGALLFGPEHDDVIAQLLAFPRGQHDDLIDALSFQVGWWDKPDKIVPKAPEGSWDDWASKLNPEIEDYRSKMFGEFKGTNGNGTIFNMGK